MCVNVGTAASTEPAPLYVKLPDVTTKLVEGVIVPPPVKLKVGPLSVKVVQFIAPILTNDPPVQVNVLEQVSVALVLKSSVPEVNVHVVHKRVEPPCTVVVPLVLLITNGPMLLAPLR